MTLVLFAAVVLAVGFLGPVYRPRCPECGSKCVRVISHGLPMWFCLSDGHEAFALGYVSRLLGVVLPFDGRLFIVPGPYLPGLYHWWQEKGGSPE